MEDHLIYERLNLFQIKLVTNLLIILTHLGNVRWLFQMLFIQFILYFKKSSWLAIMRLNLHLILLIFSINHEHITFNFFLFEGSIAKLNFSKE